MTDFRQGEGVVGRYLANRFQWAAPGDQQEDAWLVRFCDRDCGDAIFTGPDAEAEAWAYWERYAPSFNIYVFRLAALSTPPAPTSVADEPFLDQLRRVNLERYEEWVEGADAGIMFDALELGGEVGELLNVVKKLEREERGWRGSRADPADFADECADVLICLDKLARRRNVDLAAATIAKFNATSDKVGLPHKLAFAARPAGEVEQLREALQMIANLRLGEYGVTDADHRRAFYAIQRLARAALTEGHQP